jgi:hypothetical protein
MQWKTRLFLLMGGLALFAGCGSQWNLPFSSTTIPGNLSVNGSSGGKVDQSSAQDAAPAGRPFIWPHYVTWHRKTKDFSSWDKVGTHPSMWPDGYDSLDPVVIGQLNQFMMSVGMSPLTSYWEPEKDSGDKFLETYLSIPGPQLGVLFEANDCVSNSGLLRSDSKCRIPFDGTELGKENARLFREHIAHLHTNFFANPKYADRFMRVGGRVVVFIWLTGAFDGDFKSVANAVKSEFPIWIVGSNMNLYNPPRGKELESILGGLDAVSAYGIADTTQATNGEIDTNYIARYRSALQSWSQWLHQHVPNAVLIPPLLFAYDDTHVPGRTSSPLVSSREQAHDLAETAYAFIAASQETCGNVAPGALVVSLNEDYEGSSVYPTQEHGTIYTDVLREFSSRTLPTRTCK